MNEVYLPYFLEMKKIKIESTVIRGLPRFTFFGMPPQSSRNLSLKLRSCLDVSGFKWSLKRHMIMSCSRCDLNYKKNPQLELAVYVKFLFETAQLTSKINDKLICVGELTLLGEVLTADVPAFSECEDEVWIGNFKNRTNKPLRYIQIEHIHDLKIIDEKHVCRRVNKVSEIGAKLSFEEALSLHGGHSLLSLNASQQRLQQFKKQCLNHQDFSYTEINSLTSLNYLKAQENTNIFFIDDYFKINKKQKELLVKFKNRENLKQFYATTVICPCSKLTLKNKKPCSMSLKRCHSLIQNTSLEELEIFDICVESSRTFSLRYKDLLNAKNTQKQREQKILNTDLKLETLESMKSKKASELSYLSDYLDSERHKKVLSVARSVADFEGEQEIQLNHIEKSLKYSYDCFNYLKEQI